MNKSVLPPKGTIDIWGKEWEARDHIISIIKQTLESFGFQPLETPLIERSETLSGKYGQEAQNLIFWVPDHEVGLRYDHTVPLARFVANNQSTLPFPYRRFALGPVFRGENTQAGRNRQFFQCDFDTIGSSSAIVDAEVVAINYTILTALGFTNQFTILINDRALLNALVTEMGFENPKERMLVMMAWDKLDKMTPDEVFEQYLTKQMEKEGVGANELRNKYKDITEFLYELQKKESEEILTTLGDRFSSKEVHSAIRALHELLHLIADMGVPAHAYQVNPLLARGLSYYTGPIFETVVTTSGIGSLTGGGRYDQLIEHLGGPNLPACGSSFGLERIMFVMEKLDIKPQGKDTTKALVTIFDKSDRTLLKQSFHLVQELRKEHIATELYAGEGDKLGKQFSYADKRGIPFAIVIGPQERDEQLAKIKNMQTGEEHSIPQNEVAAFIKG